jgi:hypothetical protein
MTARNEYGTDRFAFKNVCYGIRDNTRRYIILPATMPFLHSVSQVKGAERKSQVLHTSLNCKCKCIDSL